MNIHIITYATHNEGLFDKLINNEYNINVIVLGFGEKWNGFMDKMIYFYEYIKTLPENDIVFFIDGFDSYINQPSHIIKQRFLSFNKNIVLSGDKSSYISYLLFGTCYDNMNANSGLYSGYNKSIQELLEYIIQTNYSKDDQKNLNKACKYFMNDIIIDSEKLLFHNLSQYERYFNDKTDSAFVSYPGTLSLNRIKRIPKEYLPMLYNNFCYIIFLIILYINCIKYHK